MKKANIPATLYYCTEKSTTFDDIPVFAKSVFKRLYDELKNAAVEPCGPPEFHYFNVEPTGTKPFTLLIAFPVKEKKDTEGEGFFMETETFPCFTKEYQGPIDGIGEAWMTLVDLALEEGYLLQNQCREVYTLWENPNSPKNLTELQVGIAGKRLRE